MVCAAQFNLGTHSASVNETEFFEIPYCNLETHEYPQPHQSEYILLLWLEGSSSTNTSEAFAWTELSYLRYGPNHALVFSTHPSLCP